MHPASLILFLIKKNAYSNAVFYSIDLIHYTSLQYVWSLQKTKWKFFQTRHSIKKKLYETSLKMFSSKFFRLLFFGKGTLGKIIKFLQCLYFWALKFIEQSFASANLTAQPSISSAQKYGSMLQIVTNSSSLPNITVTENIKLRLFMKAVY